MIDPQSNDIGRRVIYRDLGGRGKIEEGVITSFNTGVVFVQYKVGCCSQATSREDLEWSTRGPEDLAVQTDVRGGRVEFIDLVPLPEDPAVHRRKYNEAELELIRAGREAEAKNAYMRRVPR